MATRSTISILTNDDKVLKIYCHYDGYLSKNGIELYAYYNDYNKILELVNLGDISSLDKEFSFINKYNTDYKLFGNLTDFMLNLNYEEYNYLWFENRWFVNYYNRQKDEWLELIDLLKVDQLCSEKLIKLNLL